MPFAIARSSCHFHRRRAPGENPEPNENLISIQPAGGALGLAEVRLRAPELERRLAAGRDDFLVLGRADLVLEAVLAFAVGALRVAPVLRGAAFFATGLEEAVVVPLTSSAHFPERTR